jgi:predicted regulator of Ras-like GTPase activity (Roadblock/LC7/MglB family)
MADLATIARIPHLASVVLGDAEGGLQDAIREADGESVASVAAFVATSLRMAGEELGIGALRRIAIAGEKRGMLVAVAGGALLTARVDPVAAIAAVEKALDTSVGTGG